MRNRYGLLCFFGWHKWWYRTNYHRECRRCNMVDISSKRWRHGL
jgi:hypothetical protein